MFVPAPAPAQPQSPVLDEPPEVERREGAVPAATQSGTVTARALNVRQGPSTDTDRIGSLSRGAQVVITGNQGAWQQINYGGSPAWVHGDYVEVSLASGSYEVQAGDTLWRIANAQLGDGDRWPEIAQLNGITDPRTISPGQQLRIPGGSGPASEAPAPTAPATPEAPAQPEAPAAPETPAVPEAGPAAPATPEAPAQPAAPVVDDATPAVPTPDAPPATPATPAQPQAPAGEVTPTPGGQHDPEPQPDADPATVVTLEGENVLTPEQAATAITYLQDQEARVNYHYGFLQFQDAFFRQAGYNNYADISYATRVEIIARWQRDNSITPTGQLDRATGQAAGLEYRAGRGYESDQTRGPLQQAVAVTLHNPSNANDREFINVSDEWVNSNKPIRFGNTGYLPVSEGENIAKLADIGPALAAARAEAQAAAPEGTEIPEYKISELAFFTHGISNKLKIGGTWYTADQTRAAISGYLASSVSIYLYACSTTRNAESGSGYAHGLAAGIAGDGHDVEVWGHANAAHTTYNHNLHRITAQATDGANFRCTDSAAWLRDPENNFAPIMNEGGGNAVIPEGTELRVTERNGEYAHAVGLDGTDWGWTKSSNLSADVDVDVDTVIQVVREGVTSDLVRDIAAANGYANVRLTAEQLEDFRGRIERSDYFLGRWGSTNFSYEITTHPEQVIRLILHRFMTANAAYMQTLNQAQTPPTATPE